MLIYLYKGFLPWSNYDIEDNALLKKATLNDKEKFNIKLFCGEVFNELIEFYDYMRDLSIDDMCP